MSRWTTSFQQHPFQGVWKHFQELLAEVKIDDITISTAVEELSRLKAVTAYIEEICTSLEPDFVPLATWGNFYSQVQPAYDQLAAYQSNRNVAHLAIANDHLDNILSYVKPYLVLPEKTLRPLRSVIRQYKAETAELNSNLRSEATEILVALRNAKELLEGYSSKSGEIQVRINAYEEELFTGKDGYMSTKEVIQNAKNNSQKLTSEIESFHARTISDTDSLKVQLEEFEALLSRKQSDFDETHRINSEKSEKLAQFYTKIFGSPTLDGMHDGSGLERELDVRLEQLIIVEAEQKPRYEAIFHKIEGLLPGANSAGLASAYGNLAEKFTGPIKSYTGTFYVSLGLLLLIAFLTSTENIEIWPKLSVDFIEVNDWNMALRGLLYKLPFIGPLIWLAMFSSARRSQYERLQQEYSHKEALARSYESYKKELKDIGQGSEEMLKALISRAIETISFNASTTLDGKHNEPTPASKIFDNLKREDAEKLLEKLSEIIAKAKKD